MWKGSIVMFTFPSFLQVNNALLYDSYDVSTLLIVFPFNSEISAEIPPPFVPVLSKFKESFTLKLSPAFTMSIDFIDPC